MVDRVGKTLKEFIKDKGLTQEDFAHSVGLSRTILSEYSSGRKTPGLDKAILIASKLGISLKELSRSLGYDVSHLPDD
jgi:transcriptional regulator with XRE-family HTH domain